MYTIIETTTNDISIAKLISNKLLDLNLSPCVQIIKNINSIYTWNSKIVKEVENLVKIKSTLKNLNEIKCIILEFHNYDNPEIISYNFNVISDEYKLWFKDNCK